LKGILRGLTENRAGTDPTATDRRLRGRTYAIPFETVWQAASRLADGGIRGWSMLSSDDQLGVIEAVAKTLIMRKEQDVRIEVRLDENAQTRVDAWSSSRIVRGDLGRNRRTIGKFVKRLDRALDVQPGQVLDPTIRPAWLEPQ